MKNNLILIAVTVVLSSCAPLNLHYKEGQTVARMSNDLSACEAAATKQLPKDIRIRHVAPVFYPYGFCQPYGPCYAHSHLRGYGRVERYDANESKRKDITTQCMARLGYQQVQIPACSAEVTRTTRIRSTQKLPPLTQNSCSIRIESGDWQIVNPG